MRFKVANYSRLEIRLDTLHIYNELCHFAMFADIFKDGEPGDISTELFLYKLIIEW